MLRRKRRPLSQQRFRVAKNGNGAFRVEREEVVPGDLDGGREWVAASVRTFSDRALADAHMAELQAGADALWRETTWEPV